MRLVPLLALLIACASPPSSTDEWVEVTPPVSDYRCFKYTTGMLDTKTSTINCFPGPPNPNAQSITWEEGPSPIPDYTCWFHSTGMLDNKTQASACFLRE